MNCTNCGNEMSHHHYSYHNSDANQCYIEIVECVNCQTEEPAQLAELREAGEKMAEALRCLQKTSYFIPEDAAALAEWEAANK